MCLSTQRRLVPFTTLFFLLFSYNSLHSQLTLFGDLYIAPQNEMHIAAGDLYFKSGKIITDRGANSGTLSFAEGTTWERANHDTHVDGFIRFYDREGFTFPVDHDNVLQPALLSDFSGNDHFPISIRATRSHYLVAMGMFSRCTPKRRISSGDSSDTMSKAVA
jgi:hypothetical protein